mgnify:CR=1 FL=1
MNQKGEQKMGTESIPKLMVSMAVPSIIAQIINILYNIVDRIYIGHIPGVGAAALTGVGITFPIITLISAFSVLWLKSIPVFCVFFLRIVTILPFFSSFPTITSGSFCLL